MKSLGKFPDPFIGEISGQPDAVRRAATGLRDDVTTLHAIAAAAAGRHIVFTGMGSSYDACYPAVTELALAGIAATMLDAAELLHFRTAILGHDALLVAISQSGESIEVVRTVDRVRAGATPPIVVAVTNGTENSLARSADHVIDTRRRPRDGPIDDDVRRLAGLGRRARACAHRVRTPGRWSTGSTGRPSSPRSRWNACWPNRRSPTSSPTGSAPPRPP